jgi:hypothetical protein
MLGAPDALLALFFTLSVLKVQELLYVLLRPCSGALQVPRCSGCSWRRRTAEINLFVCPIAKFRGGVTSFAEYLCIGQIYKGAVWRICILHVSPPRGVLKGHSSEISAAKSDIN